MNATQGNINNAISWWEKRRLMFNIISVVVLAWLFKTYLGIILILLLIANVAYTVGWVSEWLMIRFFKSGNFDNALRWVFFVLGTLMTQCWFDAFLIALMNSFHPDEPILIQ